MSRIGRTPVTIPSGVDVTISGRSVTVKGPRGELSLDVVQPIEVAKSDGAITVTRPNDEGEIRALHGLSRSLIANMVTGVTEGYSKTLEIVGVGYRVQARGKDLEFSLGFSHPVPVTAPDGITLRVESAHQLSRWAFLLTFAGVGLRTNLKDLFKQGARPFIVGAVGEVAIAAVTLLLVLAADHIYRL